MRNPLAERLYILTAMAEAANACELLACQIALRALEQRHPWTKGVACVEPPKPDEALTDFLF